MRNKNDPWEYRRQTPNCGFEVGALTGKAFQRRWPLSWTLRCNGGDEWAWRVFKVDGIMWKWDMESARTSILMDYWGRARDEANTVSNLIPKELNCMTF